MCTVVQEGEGRVGRDKGQRKEETLRKGRMEKEKRWKERDIEIYIYKERET